MLWLVKYRVETRLLSVCRVVSKQKLTTLPPASWLLFCVQVTKQTGHFGVLQGSPLGSDSGQSSYTNQPLQFILVRDKQKCQIPQQRRKHIADSHFLTMTFTRGRGRKQSRWHLLRVVLHFFRRSKSC